ncbi:RHS repeat-associated core domain-containing protein [Kibdelosporangium banguiense]|nr:RHS repeat-associated core domain-containing protein [Kibdelosporangium banguiense]
MLVLTLVGAMLAALPGLVRPADAAPADRWSARQERSVPGQDAVVQPAGPDQAKEKELRAPPAVTWPRPGVAELSLAGEMTARAEIAGFPVRVGLPEQVASRAEARQAAPAKVRVEMLDRRLDGPVFRLNRVDAGAAGKVSVEVDYSQFRGAFGGDWATRLRLVALPECALQTPDRDDCQGTSLSTRNDGSGKLVADATAPPKDGLYAVQAAAAGGAGDFGASQLSPSSSWTAGGASGDFNWSYPMSAPPALNGPVPQLSLSYSSGAVDGRTSATNNQPSWAGEGFDFNPGGFIERRYTSCGMDKKDQPENGGAPNNKDHKKTGDQCWATDNAYFSLNGKGGELVRDNNDKQRVWHPRQDDGSRVEQLFGANNGDNDGEYWRITTRNGTQFYFGLNRIPGWRDDKDDTSSAWTVPVSGNHPKDPCYQSSIDKSFCAQGWRWNLDYVVDPHGNTMSYFYQKETNHYARDITATKVSAYDRGGYLTRIEYGQRDKEVFSTLPVAKVIIKTADRCLPGTPAADCVSSKPTNWPDTPWDQYCASTTNCKDKYSPTYWTQKRLEKITTQVRSGTSFVDVAAWTFRHSFADPQDGTTARLWLNGVQHAGLAGGTAALPEVIFAGRQLNNVVDGTTGIPILNWFRIQSIRTESGGELTVGYSDKECTAPSGVPAPDTNDKRCYQQKWTPATPDQTGAERKDWFNKYVVTEVTEKDLTSGSQPTRTEVEYASAPAWHHDEEDGLVPAERKTWAQWRGYERVKVRKGLAGGLRSMTETAYFRGMDGDKLESGGRKAVSIRDSKGGQWPDTEQFAGTERESLTYVDANAGGTPTKYAITEPWLSEPTATRTRSWGTSEARRVFEAKVRQGEQLPDGKWRETGQDNVYNAEGVLEQTSDFGDLADPNDDSCITHTYVRNDAAWLIELPARSQKVSVACGKQPNYPADVVTDERVYYDNNETYGAPPVRGDITRKEEIVGWENGQPLYKTIARATYDNYGRQTETVDVYNQKSTTSYQPAAGAPVTEVVTTNPLGHTTRTKLNPAWGAEEHITDVNQRVTRIAYDPMGRVNKVWYPGRDKDKGESPNTEFSYEMRVDGPNVVVERNLQQDGGYTTDYDLYDGLLRLRQSQDPSPNGGRVITDTVYDSRGLKIRLNGPYYNSAPPGATVFLPDEKLLPAQTVTEYDGQDRPTAEIFKANNAEKWRTTYTYEADRQHIDPPKGETPTTRIMDGTGKLVELRQYKGDGPSGDYDSTRYSYTKRGELESVTDPAGNVWRYGYDLRGRKIRADDPDQGTTEYTYDDNDRLLSEKDSRGITLAYAYDKLGRKTELHEGSLAGPKRAEWKYDTLPDGKAATGMTTTSIRYVDGNAYTTAVTAIDAANRPTKAAITIPAVEGKLARTYEFETSYYQDGKVATDKRPAVGGLSEETMTHKYNPLGMPTELSGKTTYVTGTKYNHFDEVEEVTLNAGSKWLTHRFDYEEGTHRLSRATTDRETGPQRQSDVRYSYDEAGNITRISDTPGADTGVAPDTQCFGYDYLRRLTSAWTPGNGDCAAAPSAAGLGGPASYWHTWTLDNVGNRKQETKTTPDGKKTTSTYGYSAPGQSQPHALRSVTTVGPTGTTSVDSYGYDPTGNTTLRKRAGTDQNLEWDAEGHLAKVTESGKTTSFLYDADGNRLIRRDPTGTTLYVGEDEVQLDQNGVVTATRYYSHSGKVVAVRTANGKLSWLGVDHHGTAQLAVDADSQDTQRRLLTPYGEARGAAPAWWPGEKGFVGGTTDSSTGLTHLGAREYDPTTGRFISVDPEIDHEDPQQLHGYAYANNSPVTFTDPDGRFGFSSIVHIAKTVVQPVVKTVIQPVVQTAYRQVEAVVDGMHKAWTETYHFVKKIEKKVTEHIKKVVHIAKRVYHKVEHSKAARIVKKAVKVTRHVNSQLWKGAKWVGRNSLPGGKIWNVTKLGLGIAGMFGCGVCLAVSGAMSGIDAVIAAANGNYMGAGLELMSIVPGERVAAAAGRVSKLGKGFLSRGQKLTSCNSFVPGTRVLMADGSTKPIEDLQPGDLVLATNPETGVTEVRPVVATIIGEGEKNLVELTVDTGTQTGTVVATDGHPFWAPDLKEWVTAGELHAGSMLQTATGTQVRVVGTRAWTAQQQVRNLTVDGMHTYFVLAGDTALLNHNNSCPHGVDPAKCPLCEKNPNRPSGNDEELNRVNNSDRQKAQVDDKKERTSSLSTVAKGIEHEASGSLESAVVVAPIVVVIAGKKIGGWFARRRG